MGLTKRTAQETYETLKKNNFARKGDIDLIVDYINDAIPSDGNIEADIISEETSGTGVTVDGVLLKDYCVDAGASGHAGTVDIFPSTESKGKIAIAAVANSGNTTLTITNVAQTGAANFTIPNSGAGYFAVSTAALTLVETDVLDGATAGTQVASKAVIADSNVNTGVSKITELHIGISGSETQVTATGTELNLIDGASNANSTASVAAILDSSKDLVTNSGVGTAGAGTVSIKEYGDGHNHVTVLTLTDFIVGALAGAGAALAMGNIAYVYPAGQHFELVSSLTDVVLTATGTAVASDTGLGSVIGTGATALLSGTADFEDRLTGQTIGTNAVGGTAASAIAATTAGIGTGIALNAASDIKNVFLNSAGTWNADNTGNLTATGTITLKWTTM